MVINKKNTSHRKPFFSLSIVFSLVLMMSLSTVSFANDIDLDDDGVADVYEAEFGCDDTLADTDGDGLDDGVELAYALDCDYADTDEDGISDFVEGIEDTDEDGIINALDEDSDGDGIFDFYEGLEDSNGNGVPDYIDTEAVSLSESADIVEEEEVVDENGFYISGPGNGCALMSQGSKVEGQRSLSFLIIFLISFLIVFRIVIPAKAGMQS